MKLEIIKEYSTALTQIVYRVYVDGCLNRTYRTEKEARNHVQQLENDYILCSEVIYVKELA